MGMPGQLPPQARAIVRQTHQAGDEQALAAVSRAVVDLIRTLQEQGVRTSWLARLVNRLNSSIFARLYALLAPPELLERSCLLVMGSEGRQEQILRTDQDNALILADDGHYPDLETVTRRFSDRLVDFGYPPCPGNIMVSNPAWAKTVRDYRAAILDWIEAPTEEDFLTFAIFFDARAVAGDPQLLTAIREEIDQRLQDKPVFYARFARPTLSFATPLNWFGRFKVEKGQHPGELDLKKGGIFPLVHGVRSLALEHRLDPRNTLERLDILAERSILERPFARDLAEAFAFMSRLRLDSGLSKLDRGLTPDNYLDPRELSRLERVQLRECLKLIDEFKAFITRHYRLDQLG